MFTNHAYRHIDTSKHQVSSGRSRYLYRCDWRFQHLVRTLVGCLSSLNTPLGSDLFLIGEKGAVTHQDIRVSNSM